MMKKIGSLWRLALRGALVTLLVAVCATPSASARHRRQVADAQPGRFDYYMLSLSWSPAFCLRSPRAAECNGPRRYGFILHGLWPQNERGWPENCEGDPQLPDRVADEISDLMPARGLIFHEWAAHGTCSGLPAEEFFMTARRAHDSVRIPAALTGPTAAVEQTPSSIVNAFLRENPRLPADSVSIACSGQDTPRLTEVHVCFDRGLSPRACSADVLRRSCRAASVIVAPVR